MCAPSTPNDGRYNCVECDKSFTRNYSLARHIVRAHKIVELHNRDTSTQQNQHQSNNNDTKKQQNQHPDNNNDTGTQETDVGTIKKYECDLCHNNFSHSWCLTRHKAVCKGAKVPFECKNCLKTFKHARSLLRHSKKICEKNKEGTVITTNIGTQNNINTQNIQTQNNTNNIIIVYNPNGGTPFTSDHLTTEDFKKILKLASPNIDSRAMAEYSKQILSHPENRCIKKKDLKSGHSQVHTGDDKWELQLDKIVYPQLASDMANNMVEFINAKRDELKKNVFDQLRNFVDYMADNGYINTDDVERQKEIQNEYKNFVKGLKLIVYGNPKDV